MKGIYTPVIDLRRRVFSEIAKLGYEVNDYENFDEMLAQIPYEICPGEEATYRDSIFLERAIVEERIRLSLGLPLRKMTEASPVSKGVKDTIRDRKYYEPPLINIIKFACNRCPEKRVKVSDQCRGCLAHPCTAVCPKNCIHIINGKSHIDQSLCIKCGLCADACPYNAIIKTERPCAKSCGVNAISSDSLGRAEIDYDKCVSCGMCMANCPFGAISDKAQIFQLIQAMKAGTEVIAAIAPSFIGQFGKKVTTGQLITGLKMLGFSQVYEVAVGADLCTVEEAHDFLENVPEKMPWMGTSCCPAWSKMAKRDFPELKDQISMTMTPMVFTARLIKKDNPDAKVVFIGPCAAKKLEASRTAVKSHVDFVLTFEECLGMMKAKDINLESLEPDVELITGSEVGRGFASSGGVANAVYDTIKHLDPERAKNLEIIRANGLHECVSMLKDAKRGKYNHGCLLEGMACPGGCIGGTGTLADTNKNKKVLDKYSKSAKNSHAYESEYMNDLRELYKEWFNEWEG